MKRLLLLITIFISTVSFGQTNTSSISFDGMDDYIQVTHNVSLSLVNQSSFTVQCWVKNSEVWQSPQWGYIVTKTDHTAGWGFNGGYCLRVGADATVPFGYGALLETTVGEDNFFTENPISDQWENIAMTYDGGYFKIYRNGIPTDSIVVNGDVVDYTGDLILGAAGNGTTHFFDGLMDDLSIWDIVLSANDVLNNMNCPPTGSETGLVGYWNFEEGTGTTSGDLSSNANDGTLIGGVTWSTDVPEYNCNVGVSELSSNNKELIKIVNLLGQEVEFTPNTVLIYQYSDGTSEKVFTIED